MARRLFTVEDTFLIEGRGIVPVPGIEPQGDERFRIGDSIILKRPDGSEIEWQIGGLELLCPRPRPDEVVVLLRGLGKDDIPIGTEIWSVDNDCDTSIISSRPWSEVVRFYREIADNGSQNEPMFRFVEQIAASGYAVGLFAYTSMFTLCMAHTHTIRRCQEELRIAFDPIGHEFHFEYWSHPFVKPGPWRRTCGESEGFATLERILLKRVRWFNKQPLS
jgi:hypothetical protein